MNNLKENLENIRSRVDLACRTAGRSGEEVAILAVSKRHSAERIEALHALGQAAFGENYVQEALDKIDRLRQLPIEWHYIGPLQSNKTREAAGHFHWVQTLDRAKIAKPLSDQRPAELPLLNVCVQVNIDREPQKHGVMPEEAEQLARLCAGLPRLRLRGLMCIPPVEEEPSLHFALLAKLAARNGLSGLSMGMSGDFESAIALGATHVRVGSAIFGERTTA